MITRTFVAVTTLALCSIAGSVAAQEQQRSDASYATETSFTYSLLRDVGETGTTGMVVDFGKQLKPRLNAIGEVAIHRFASFEETYTGVAGGLRYGAVANGRMRPFAQVLVGVQHDFGATGFNIQPGGGLNVRVADKFDAKVQVDFPLVRWEGESYKQFRFSVGLGVPLGR